nr:hypothetical protein [Tanacetum cinerariifolium]
MATTIEKQTALDESLVPRPHRLRLGRSNFRLPSDIQSKEATLQVSVLDLEAFREMLHISPRIPNQPFADLPTEEEILDFLMFLGHSHDIRYLTDVNVNKLYQPWISFASVINKKPSISRRNRIHWRYVRADALFSTIKVVSRHQTTQQYGAILPIELTTSEIRNSKAYQEYHACAVGEAAPKPKASAKKKKGDSASSTTPPTPTPTTTVESAPRLHETHILQQSGFGTGEGTGSKLGVPDVPSDDSEEELSWKSSDDEDVVSHEEGKQSDESDDDSDEGSDNDSDETVKSGAG